jgi:hypothetical protein
LARLLPAFIAASRVLYPPNKIIEGMVRQWQVGGGAKGLLPQTVQMAYPGNTTLDKDTGFQGYEPAGVLTQ